MTRVVRRRTAVVLAVAVLGLGAAGCSSASPTIAPSGVDELVVPVAFPEPGDFVALIDNPWLALPPAPGPVIAGVPTTEVVASGAVDYYAQDTRGNVWLFGREHVWAVGTDGAQAGLVITATPRLGDGYQSARYRSVVAPVADVDLVAEVVGIDVVVDVGTTTYEGCVVIETRDLVDASVERSWYAEGVGRVKVSTSTVE